MPTRILALVATLIVTMPALAGKPAASAPAAAEKPRLVVIIVIDQFRGDYPERFAQHFGPDGFERLKQHGAYYPDAHYSHGATATGPGHACIATGSNPRTHGISANQDLRWECVENDGYRLVGLEPGARDKGGVCPMRLLVPTLGDVMKTASPRSKVVSIGIKSRAAALLGGHRADRAIWWDSATGRFISSRYYGDSLPPYIEKMNNTHAADRWFGKEWTRALPDAVYRDCDPVDDPNKIDLHGLGRTFPHPLTGGLKSPGPEYYEALETTPFGDDLVLEAVAQAIDGEKLGSDDACDLLCVALSAFDIAGHFYGPDSQEMLDFTVRTDRSLADFWKVLDAKVGAGRYVVALTADHGVTPAAAHSKRLGLDAGTIRGKELLNQLNQHLGEVFVKGKRSEGKAKAGDGKSKFKAVAMIDLPWLYLNGDFVKKHKLSADAVLAECKQWLETQPGIEWARESKRIAEPLEAGSGERRRFAHEAYHPQMAGDLYIAVKPYWHKVGGDQAASHGSYHEYDRHVPVMLYGPGIRAGRNKAGDPIDIAKTLCTLLGIQPPATMTGRVLSDALTTGMQLRTR